MTINVAMVLFPAQTMVLMICRFVLFCFFGQSEQLQETNHSTVLVWLRCHASNASQQGKNTSTEGSTVAFPLINTMINYAVINQKKAPHWLPLCSSCCLQLRLGNSVTVSCSGWEHESVLLSLVDGLLPVMFQNDCVRLLQFPSPHLRQHQDDRVQTTRSKPDMEGRQQVLSPNICVGFGFRLLLHLSIWQVHKQKVQRNMTGSILKWVAAFRKSCQRLTFGPEPTLNYWIHHA